MQGEKSSVNIGGWLEGLSNSLLKTDNIKLVYCYPDYNRSKVESKAEGNFLYYAIPITQNESNSNPWQIQIYFWLSALLHSYSRETGKLQMKAMKFL